MIFLICCYYLTLFKSIFIFSEIFSIALYASLFGSSNPVILNKFVKICFFVIFVCWGVWGGGGGGRRGVGAGGEKLGGTGRNSEGMRGVRVFFGGCE